MLEAMTKFILEYGQISSPNKAYTLRSEYLAWPSAHLPLSRGKKLLDLCKLIEYKISSRLGKRRISKTLYDIVQKI